MQASEQWTTNPVRQSVEDSIAQVAHQQPGGAQNVASQPASLKQPNIAQADFISRPRLIEIGGAADNQMPRGTESPNDANWIIGAARGNVTPRYATHITHGSTNAPARTASYVQQAAPQAAPLNSLDALAQPKVVSGDSIAAIRAETQGADVERLQLMLSRLMAKTASVHEAQPILEAATNLAERHPDALTVARAKLLVDRVQQYQRIAQQRDGQTFVQNPISIGQTMGGFQVGAQSVVPASATVSPPAPPSNTAAQVQSKTVAPPTPTASGYLVQVYSSRTNSPPYALTDNVGNTITYVSPAPGIDLRPHLNNQISVFGSQGYVQGLKTPHVLVTKAIRAGQ